MESYIWLLPILFVFHDFEEIIGFGQWYKKNNDKIKLRFPKQINIFQKLFYQYSTEGMALAVFEELLLCILICLTAILFDFYLFWIGTFIAFVIHLLIHLVQSIVWKGYIPAVITSIITLPISIVIIVISLELIRPTLFSIISWSIISLVIVAINLKFAHLLMHKFTKWIEK